MIFTDCLLINVYNYIFHAGIYRKALDKAAFGVLVIFVFVLLTMKFLMKRSSHPKPSDALKREIECL